MRNSPALVNSETTSKKRIFAAGGPQTETNTFCKIHTTLAMFSESYLKHQGQDPDNSSFWALPNRVWSQLAFERGHEYIESLRAGAEPAGPVVKEVYETLRDEVLNDLKAAMPVDMVLLNLHGAMIADGYDDCEGDILKKVREIVGPDVPVGLELDLHAQLTKDMVSYADIIVMFKHYPHTDVADRAREVFVLTESCTEGEITPKISIADANMINLFPTTHEPMTSIVKRMYQIEEDKDVLSVSLSHGFPWGDVEALSAYSLVITNDNQPKGDLYAEELAQTLYSKRAELQFHIDSLNTAMSSFLQSKKATVIWGDFADNPGGGGMGDATFILQRVLQAGINSAAFVTIWDPKTVTIAIKEGLGAVFDVAIGGQSGVFSGAPCNVRAKVVNIAKSLKQELLDGSSLNLGDTVALEIENNIVLVNSVRSQIYTPSPLISMGYKPEDFSLIVVKSSVHFQDAFKRYGETWRIGTEGVLNPNFSSIDYKKVSKGRWPLEDHNAADT